MTLEEKIGQMTLVSAGWVVTGPKVSGDYMAAIKAGRIGAISNLWGPEETREVQRVAVEETRLGRAAAVRLRRDPRPPHHIPDPAGRGGGLRSGPVGADGARRRRGSRRRWAGPRLRPDAGCGARPALGPDRREPGRRSLARRPLCRSQGARFPGRRHRPSGQSGGDRQAPRRLRSGHRRPRLRLGGHLRALVPGGLSAAVPRGRGRRGRRHHAGIPRLCRRADDGECRGVERSGAPPLGVRRRHGQRPRGGRRTGRARRGRGPRRGGSARAARRDRHRPHGRRLRPRPAARARARPRDHGADRCRGPARARAQGPPWPAGRSVPPQQGRAGAGGSGRGAAAAGAGRRAPLDRAPDQPGGRAAVAGRSADRRDRAARGCPRRHAGTVGGRRSRRRHGDDPRRAARRAPGQRDPARARGRSRSRGAQRHRRRARSGPPRRGRGAVPGRGPRHERRGGEPRPPRPARTPGGARAGGARRRAGPWSRCCRRAAR